MKPLLTLAWIGLLVMTTGCKKPKNPAPPKAVAVATGGALELKLLTINLRYENTDDRDSRAWSQRITGIVRMIHHEAPDVITIQEGLHGQVADLFASLPDYTFVGVGRDDGKRMGEYTGAFYRHARFEHDLNDTKTFWLSDTPDIPGSKSWGNEITREASWLRLIDRSTQRGFYVFTTHLDHRNQTSREKSALLLAQRIDTRSRSNEPVILMGDFNSNEKNPAIAYLTGQSAALAGKSYQWPNGMIDTFRSLHPNDPSRTTLHFWSNQVGGSLKVDYIFVSRGAKVIRSEILHDAKPMLSDHFPVTARVIIPQ